MVSEDLQERADRAEEMLPVAAHLAMLVHGDGGPEDIQAVLDGIDAAQTTALIVVLAGLVNPDQPISAALAWLDPAPRTDGGLLLRSLLARPDADADVFDPVAVEAYLVGRPVDVTPEERLEAIVRWVRRGKTYAELDVWRGLRVNSTVSFLARLRKTYAEQRQSFPLPITMGGVPLFSDEQVLDIREKAEAGATNTELSLEYGVARKTIGLIVSGERYQHAGGPIRPRAPQGADLDEPPAEWVRAEELESIAS